MSDFRGDLRFAVRQLTRSPGFTAAALVCLALGTGATSAIFTVVNAVVLRPLPYKESQNLVRLYTEWPTWPGGGMWRFWVSPPEFRDLRRDNQVFETVDAWQPVGVNLSTSGREPVRVNATLVSGTLLSSLGVAPMRGRLLEPADDAEGAPPAIVISYGLWQGAFGGEDGVIGKQVTANGFKATVAGVMPRGFEFPPGQTEPAEVWSPLQLTSRDMDRWGNHRLSLIARLKPGLTASDAARDLDRMEREFGQAASNSSHRPNPTTHTLTAFPLIEETIGDVRPAMLLLLGATALVLLIACGNVANLLLARAQTRQREVAVRQAMGASAGGLMRQFLLEGLLLSGTGAVLGLALGWAMLRLILTAGAGSIPRASEVQLDGAVLAFTLAGALLTGVVFALAPLAQTIRTRLFETLKSGGGRTTATREAHWLRSSLVVGEMALALVLLGGAALLLDAFWRLTKTDPGVRSAGIMSMRVALPMQDYPQPDSVRRFWSEALGRVHNLPGVTGAALIAGLPPDRPINANDTFIEGLVPKPGGPGHNVAYWNGVSPGAFEMLGVKLVEGRLFDQRDGDGAPPVLIVNQTFARSYYGDQSALGRRVKPGGSPNDQSPWFTIIGVVKDIKNAGLDKPAATELFFSLSQSPNQRMATLLVKTAGGDPWSLVAPVRSQIHSIDASLPLSQVRPLDDAIASARAQPRFLAMLLALFAAVALGLAATGIFSVMTYAVAQRTSEFGVRLALGARASQVLGLVIAQGMKLVAVGAAVGAIAGWVLMRILRTSISGLGEIHWVPLALVLAVLILVTMAACLAPARRATLVDPVNALRTE